ncbi:MAG: divergent polysaccharide deacetylase family protein [Pseudomonadota bacterium]
MDYENEFEKPLKGYSPDRASTRKRSLAIVFAVFLVLGFPIFHFYDGWARMAGLFKEEAPVEVATVVADTEPEVEEAEAETPTEIPKAKQDYELDPDGGDIQVVKPQGELVELTPATPQTPRVQPVRRQEQALAHLPDPELIERGATGVIPKKSKDGLRAMDVYSRQPDTEGNFGVARVVIVIGGLGISQTTTQQAIRELPGSVTLAFAPYGNSLVRWMQEARKGGHELLLQVPMEPLDYPQNNPGPHTLKAAADLEENLANLHWSMSRFTNYVGVTNYLGNKILQQPASLSPIFAELSERGMLFFEDGTVKNSMGQGVALKELLPYAKADILIDNVRSRAAIFEKLNKLSEQAKRTGLAIGVGNAFPDTIALVSQYVRQARQNGIEITPLASIVKDPAQ